MHIGAALLSCSPYRRLAAQPSGYVSCRQLLANATSASSRVGSAALLERRYLAVLPTRIWDLLAKDYAVSCPHASSFDVAISARR
jgi:hypothetical protein